MPNAVTSFANAVAAYDRATRSGGLGMDARDAGSDATFAGLVKNAIEDAVAAGKKSEQASIAAISDRADINQVVTAVAEAEVVLQTVVAIRDRVIDAYKDIMRMPI